MTTMNEFNIALLIHIILKKKNDFKKYIDIKLIIICLIIYTRVLVLIGIFSVLAVIISCLFQVSFFILGNLFGILS